LSRHGLSISWAISVPRIAPGDCPCNTLIWRSLSNSKFKYDAHKEIWLHWETQTVVKVNKYSGKVLKVKAQGICSSMVETFLSSSDWEPILFGKELLEWVSVQVLSSTYLTKEMVSLYRSQDGFNGFCDSDSDWSDYSSYSDTVL